MSNGDDFFGLNKDEQVQNLEEDIVPAKKGKFKMGKGGGSSSAGKIIGICMIISLVFSMVSAWFIVSMVCPSKSAVNNTIAAVNTLSGDLSDFQESTSQALTSKATESWVTNQGYSTQTWVNAKVSDLASQTWVTTQISNAINASGGSTGGTTVVQAITLLAGNCNVSVSGGCVGVNTSVLVQSGKAWTKAAVSGCTLNLTATPVSGNFSGWSINGVTNTSNPINISISGETFIMAVTTTGGGLTPTPTPVTYALTVSPTAGGTASFDGTSPFVNGSVVPIHAVAETGFVFNGWTPITGIASSISANTNVSMTANRSITANFVSCIPLKPTLTYPDTGNTSVVNGSVHFTWSDCGDGVLYDFYFSATSSFGDPILEDLEVPACDWIAPNSNTWYYWKVVATGGCGTKSTTGYFRTSP